MGVYIELYAPIFNYNSMSQVIKKFEPGGKTTQPRLYKRGNDDIDLDAYIRDAESEFGYWLANSRLKDKEKQQVREAYSRMIQGINDGTFTYKIGGGYNNSVGMSNQTKGFDAAGLAAGFLGNVLRNQSVYKAPEEKPDPSKIKWEGNSSVGSALVKRLYGSDKESLNDFIDLDLPDPKTKKRGNTERSARFKSGLEYVKNNFDSLFTSFTDSDKATALENIDLALSAFNNGTVEDNEYLDLSRATGMSNLRDMFFSGETYGNTAYTPATPSTGDDSNENTYTNEDEWRAATHPRSTVTDLTNRSLTTTAVYKREGRIRLNSILMTMPKDNLLKLIRTGLKYSPTGQELNRGRSILQGFGQLTSFENNFIIRQALEAARRRKILHQFPTDPNSYYIPFVSSTLNSRRTGFVYTISPDGNHTLREMDRWDIPFYTTHWHDDFIKQVPSNKKGGKLKKFEGGGWFEKLYKQQALMGWTEDSPNDKWDSNTTFHGHAGDLSSVAAANQAYTADINAVGQDINNFVKTFDENLTPEQIVAQYNENAQKIRSFWEDQDVNYKTTNAQEHNRLFAKMFNSRSQTTGGTKAYNLSYQKDLEPIAGSQTWHRRMDRYEKEFDQLTPEERKARTFTITRILNGKPQVFEVYKKANGDIALLNDLVDVQNQTKDEIQKEIRSTPQLGLTPDETAEQKPQSVVDEDQLPPPGLDSPKFDWKEITSDLIGVGRLWASLHTNNKVYNTVLPSLKPVLKDTYERYSPILGDLSILQQASNSANKLRRQSAIPITSDASLEVARQLEAEKHAQDIWLQGLREYRASIENSRKEALARQEDNMARRSEVANFNRASINQTNRERAQLGATRLKSNWQSWDNFLQGFESRIRTRMDENREHANNFYDRISANQAEKWYNNAIEPAKAALLAWTKTDEGRNADYTEWSEWDRYQKYLKEARARANAMIYQSMANRYGLHYTNPYTEESNALFNWNRRYV